MNAIVGRTGSVRQPTLRQRGVETTGNQPVLDWGASQFLSKQFFVGLVGYAYDQVSADGGSGDRVGAFESRVFSVGPQLGYVFPLNGLQGFLGAKAYFEFGAKNRPEGFNTWLTFAISEAAPTPSAAPPMRVHK